MKGQLTKFKEMLKEILLSETELMEAKTKDGSVIEIEEMEIGGKVFIATPDEETGEINRIELPDGEYPLTEEAEGITIKIQDGAITEIEKEETETETETEVEMTREDVEKMMDEKLTSLKEEIKAMLPEVKEEMSKEEKAELAKQEAEKAEEAKKAELAAQEEEAERETGAPKSEPKPSTISLSKVPSRESAVMTRIANIKHK